MSKRIPASVSHDIRQFLAGYPNRSSSSASANLAFYQDKGPARPSRSNYSELLAELKGNWSELEYQHGFIQWIFPIREKGMNWESQPLELSERDTIMGDPAAMERLLTSYRLMLEFYGQVLVSDKTGQIARTDVLAPAPGSWRVRYANLLSHSHNFLRITRILKCNSEFGREHLNAPWILWFLVEQARGELNSSSLMSSMDEYWRWVIRADDERAWVVAKVDEVRKGGSWTEADYLAALERREKTGSFVVEKQDGNAVEAAKVGGGDDEPVPAADADEDMQTIAKVEIGHGSKPIEAKLEAVKPEEESKS